MKGKTKKIYIVGYLSLIVGIGDVNVHPTTALSPPG